MTKLVQPKKASPKRLEGTITEAVEDVCRFYRDFASLSRTYLGSCLNRHQTPEEKKETDRLYKRMKKITEKYSQNNSLKNKLEEAESYIWSARNG
jgi:hypothetical protein